MRLINKESEMPSGAIFFLLAISLIVTTILVISYLNDVGNNVSFSTFISWAFADGVALIGFVVMFYSLTILATLKNIFDKKKFNRKPHIEHLYFLPDRIDFVYNKLGCNFSCGYQDVESLEMEIVTKLERNPFFKLPIYEIVVTGINLSFVLSNKRKYNVSISTFNVQSTIYEILDYAKNVKNFRYLFQDDLVSPDCKEKIEKYMKSGYRDFLGEKKALKLKIASLVFFLFYILICYMTINTGHPVPISYVIQNVLLFSPIFIISLIIDIILIIDYIRDKNSGGYHE